MPNPLYEKVFNRAVKLLGYRARSTAQLRERLLEKSQATPEIVEQVIKRLVELGYLDDQDFAYNLATSKLSTKAMGRARLRRTLVEKKVAPETAERALKEVFANQDEELLCERALAKHVRLHGKPADAKQSQKVIAYLIRLGFPFDLAIKKVRALANCDLDE